MPLRQQQILWVGADTGRASSLLILRCLSVLSPCSVISIDGHAASGKTTVARHLAKRLAFHFISSGMMYRAAAVLLLRVNPSMPPEDATSHFDWKLLRHLAFSFSKEEAALRCFLRDTPLHADSLYDQKTSLVAASFSQAPPLRTYMKTMQRRLAAGQGTVVEGRDIGTEVFPEAPFKVFMIASLVLRAERRHGECVRRGEKSSKGDILRMLAARDRMDETRTLGKLKRPEHSFLLDTSKMSAERAVNGILNEMNRLGLTPKTNGQEVR